MDVKQTILCQEHRDELLTKQAAGREIQRMIEMSGWSEILRPTIEKRIENATKKLIALRSDSISDVVVLQEQIRALKEVLTWVDGYITEGKQAAETLKQNNG